MKYIIVVGDGMSDYPLEELDGKTPLEVADKPNMDFIARNGSSGLLNTVPEGMTPGSDIANLSLLGYDPKRYYPKGRGPLEAASRGVELEENDIALRCNLITEDDGILRDYSAGHITTEEAKELIQFVDEELGTTEIEFYPGVSYRHLTVMRNSYSDEITYMPPHDIVGERIEENLIKAKLRVAEKTADVLNGIMLKSREILKNHPINRKRASAGKNLANMVWLWGAGKKPKMPRFKEKFGLTGSLISAVDLLKGIAIIIGLDAIDVPGVTGYTDTNYEGKADYALKTLEEKDFVYIHVESTDEMGHEGNIDGKIKAIEDIDKRVIGRILNSMSGKKFAIAITPDHATPVKTKTHTSDPVPFAIYSTEKKGDSVEMYSEKSAENGEYGRKNGEELVDLLIKSKINLQTG